MGAGSYSTYFSNNQLGLSRDAVIDALHKDYHNVLFYHITGQNGIYEHSNGTNTLFLTEEDLGVPGSHLDGFDILPEQVQPGITISSPVNGSALSTATPRMSISFSDADSGIALSSFKAWLDGSDVTNSFAVTITGATWQVPSTSPLVGVNHALRVSVSDRVGNQANAVSQFSISGNHPPTASISANPLEIAPGESTVLTWSTSYASTVTIDNGVGTVAANGSLTVSPLETTTYTITATNPNGSATDSITVAVAQSLSVRLSAQPQNITQGEVSILSWTSTLADSASLDNGIGSVALNGSLSVSPLQTTTYTITVQGQSGTSSSSATVTVLYKPSVTFTATPDAILQGGTAVLTWTSFHADTASINQGIGSVALNGSRQVSPLVTTTYTITVVGSNGMTASASALVTVYPKPVVTFTANPVEIFQGEPSALFWSCTNADTVSINNSIGSVGLTGTLTVKPIKTTTYTLTATGPGGTVAKTVTVTVKSVISFSITSPTNGSQINRADTLVKGTINTPFSSEISILVNGTPALVYGNSFAANHVPLVEGSNVITVTGGDSLGHYAESSITVNASTANPFITFRSYNVTGVSPLETTFRAEVPFSTSSPTISALGPGTVELISYADDNGFNLRLTGQGIFYITANAGGYTDTLAALVLNRTTMDTLLKGKWNGMKSFLMNNDIEGALGYFALTARDEYRKIFTIIDSDLPAMATGMQDIQGIYFRERTAKYRIRRAQVIGGATQAITCYIYFVKDAYGNWYIHSF